MERYKFRGKRIDNLEWVYGSLIDYRGVMFVTTSVRGYEYSLHSASRICLATAFSPKVIPETVGQYAAAHGKDGESLDWWEGDLLEDEADEITRKEVVIDQGCFWCVNTKHRTYRIPLYEVAKWSPHIKKVGTIHDKEEE